MGALPSTVGIWVALQYLHFFTVHLHHLLITVLYGDKTYYKEPRQQLQTTRKMSSIFSIWIMDRWMNRWKQQQNTYRVMKTGEEKTLNKRHAWMFEKPGFMGILLFFIACLFFFSIHFPPLYLFFLSLSLSVAHQCGCSSVMTPTVAGPL